MKAPRAYITLTFCLLALPHAGLAISWPIQPHDISLPIGNSYGEYQYYGGLPYMHPGIDIMAPAGTPVYAVKPGYVKAVLTTSAELHWRVAVGDSAGAAECDGWLYAHLDQTSIAVYEGEWVNEGDFLGNLVRWPVADFHHLHFVKIRHSGVIWDSDWSFIGNPLDELTPIDDPDAPVFELAGDGRKFLFAQNQSTSYFSPEQPVSGNVDIICRVYDYINHYDWRLAPYRIDYRVAGDSSFDWVTLVCFTGPLDFTNNVPVVYRNDQACHTRGDYDYRQFYFTVTNTDGDSLIETADAGYSWETASFHNGQYLVYVRAFDRAGNMTVDSMPVSVANYFALSGTVVFPDGNPEYADINVSVLPDGASAMADETGRFSLPIVGGGAQIVSISRPGYETVDTAVVMNRDAALTMIMEPTQFVLGDANFDGDINVGDAVFLINFAFRNGSSPIPYPAGDANSDQSVDVGDAVYLVNYIFKDGPPPQGVLAAL